MTTAPKVDRTVSLQPEFPFLNAARAVAAFWVLLAHVTLLGGWRVPLLSQGFLAVECFIVLSGFLMMLILLPEPSLNIQGVGRFYIRRFFRIAPSFYFAVALYLIFRSFYIENISQGAGLFHSEIDVPGLDPVIGWRSIIWNGLFLHGLWPAEATKIFGPGWSLSLEMQFYLIAPFWAAALKRRPFVAIIICFAINLIGNVLWGVYFQHGLLATYWFPSFLPNRLFLFCWGGVCCLYVLQRTRTHLQLLLVTSAGATILLPWRSLLVCSILIAGILSTSLLHNRSSRFVTAVAESRLVSWLAEMSYGIYLYHVFCMAIAAWLMSRVPFVVLVPNQFKLGVFLAGVLAISLALSALIHYILEKPARAWGKRLTRRRRGSRIS